MAKFVKPNTVERAIEKEPSKTVNYEGGVAFTMTPEIELYTRVATSLVGEPKFYDEKSKDTDAAIQKLIAEVAKSNPEFVLQLAAYTRNEMYLRSIPLVLLVEACRYPETKKFVRAYVPEILKRPDELAEVVAYWIARNGSIGDKTPKGMMSNPLRRGIGDAFHNFNEYGFAKYDRDGDVKLKDVLRICHPHPKNEEESALFTRIRDRTLKTPETWEVVISGKGSTKENWAAILPKMPFMARLRNLRNLLEKEVNVSPVVEMLNDPAAVLHSKQFPYRFLSAYKMVEAMEGTNPQTRDVLGALETAMDLSCENVPKWPGVTLVATDSSGSMNDKVSEKSMISMKQIGFTLGAMATKISDGGFTGCFGDTWQAVNLNPRGGVLANALKLEQVDVGCSTNAWEVTNWMNEKKVKVDRLVLFSDMQCYDSTSGHSAFLRALGGGYTGYRYDGESLVKGITTYRRTVNPNLYVYSFDLRGYGTAQFPEKDTRTALLAGWSDKVLSLVPAFESRETITGKISAVTARTYRKKETEDE